MKIYIDVVPADMPQVVNEGKIKALGLLDKFVCTAVNYSNQNGYRLTFESVEAEDGEGE